MKVYTEVVIDMRTMEVESEESFEYEGEIAHCGGGGSSPGDVGYPLYMEIFHGDVLLAKWLSWADGNNDMYHSPFETSDVHNPGPKLLQMSTMAGAIDSELQGFLVNKDYNNIVSDTETMIAGMTDETAVDDMVDAFSDKLDENINNTVLPRFQAGMRDINAVQSSAFVVGEAVIWANRDTALAAFDAEARLRQEHDIGLRAIGAIHTAYDLELNAAKTMLEYKKASSHLQVDTGRLDIVANKEYKDGMIEMKEGDSRWPYEVLTYGGNLMSSIGGGSVQTMGRKSAAASAIGGGISGAAAGASIGATYGSSGGPYGAIIGGVLGAAAGLMSR